jgi:hypothetical protein
VELESGFVGSCGMCEVDGDKGDESICREGTGFLGANVGTVHACEAWRVKVVSRADRSNTDGERVQVKPNGARPGHNQSQNQPLAMTVLELYSKVSIRVQHFHHAEMHAKPERMSANSSHVMRSMSSATGDR